MSVVTGPRHTRSECLDSAISYSALKMDGKPLYEYARQNIPLPKPIEARNCTIYNLELTGFKSGEEHNWTGAKTELSQEEKDTMNKLESLVKNEAVRASDADAEDATSETVPQASTSTSTTEEQGNTQDQHKENGE